LQCPKLWRRAKSLDERGGVRERCLELRIPAAGLRKVGASNAVATDNRRDEARAMLADIYGWFTEDLDTADLKDAKTLLDELS